MVTARQVLFTGVDEGVAHWSIVPLRERGHLVHLAPWGAGVINLVAGTAFGAIVVGFPVPGLALGPFLRAVRAQGSQCRRAGVILLARPDALAQARQFIGNGANRAVQETALPVELVQAVVELLDIAPRVQVRVPARIAMRLQRLWVKTLFQTENLSSSGMLVRGLWHYPLGLSVDFELGLLGEVEPIRGQATVSRVADRARERIRGFGARFVSFVRDDRSRLQRFLERQRG